jgi:hypothetical protein
MRKNAITVARITPAMTAITIPATAPPDIEDDDCSFDEVIDAVDVEEDLIVDDLEVGLDAVLVEGRFYAN